MAESYTYDIGKIAQKWKRRWEEAKSDAIEGVRGAGRLWKTSSLAADEKWKNEVKKAIEENRRYKNLQQVDESFWVNRTIEGIQRKTLTDSDMQKMASRAGPYITLLKEIKAKFKTIKFPDGITAGKWWIENVSKLLEKAKGRPDLISQVRQEIMTRIEKAKAQYGAVEATY